MSRRKRHADAALHGLWSLPGANTTESDTDWLGNILVREGLISLEQLERALTIQRQTGLRLASVVVRLSMVPEERILKLLGDQYGAWPLDLASFEPDPKLVRLIPGDIARKHLVLPVARQGRTLIVAMADPSDALAIEELNFITRMAIQPAIAAESTLRSLIDQCYAESEDQLHEPLLDIDVPVSSPPTNVERDCPRCGTAASADALYCATCGANLNGDIVESTPRDFVPLQAEDSGIPFPDEPLDRALERPSTPLSATPAAAAPRERAPRSSDEHVIPSSSLWSKWKGRFSKQAPVITDDVTFTAVAPMSVKPGDFLPLDVYAHVEAIDEIIQVASRELQRPIQHKSKGTVPVQQGTALVIRVSVPVLGYQDHDQIQWNGTTGNATFLIPVGRDTPVGQYEGKVDILVAGVSIARLLLALKVGEPLPASTAVTAAVTRFSSAFASYASQDRKKVLGRIQGMQKVVPELEVFLDVSSLRSGERWKERLEKEILSRDVLFLFWSPSAMASEYVDWEWRLALAHRGIDFIDPIPLESPERAPPPDELKDKHFRDWTLGFE